MHQEALWHWETTFNFTPSPHAHRPHATPELSLKRNSHRKNLSRPWGLAACDVSGSVVGFFDRGFQRKKQSSSSKKQHKKVLFSFFFFPGGCCVLPCCTCFCLLQYFRALGVRRKRSLCVGRDTAGITGHGTPTDGTGQGARQSNARDSSPYPHSLTGLGNAHLSASLILEAARELVAWRVPLAEVEPTASPWVAEPPQPQPRWCCAWLVVSRPPLWLVRWAPAAPMEPPAEQAPAPGPQSCAASSPSSSGSRPPAPPLSPPTEHRRPMPPPQQLPRPSPRRGASKGAPAGGPRRR